jgi:hypothetical protein
LRFGSLLALDGKWQKLDKVRILMGAEPTMCTRQAVLKAVESRATERLDESIETTKDSNPFLHGVPAILEAMESGRIECRVYDRDKFHANARCTRPQGAACRRRHAASASWRRTP